MGSWPPSALICARPTNKTLQTKGKGVIFDARNQESSEERPATERQCCVRWSLPFLRTAKIETTVTRAKEVRSLAEKMITIAKTNDLHSKRLVMGFVTKEAVTNKLFHGDCAEVC